MALAAGLEPAGGPRPTGLTIRTATSYGLREIEKVSATVEGPGRTRTCMWPGRSQLRCPLRYGGSDVGRLGFEPRTRGVKPGVIASFTNGPPLTYRQFFAVGTRVKLG
jgi:hypothetical protein